ncbi:hypothetical protein PENSTE_c001G08107 [Penicillium steckii]|uniref:Zn(2)-C6 fungal-type domain-containing protein n=1 Tax=Penicillium steckii TaxID=303698 RepID=A0A1V6U071_9EURO|nr:hypothetical protein PENSTE_c001G08107 [Penicillium steckii]
MILRVIRSLFCFPSGKSGASDISKYDDDHADLLQCDEKRPSCSNCSNHNIECTFATTSTAESESPVPDTPEEPVRRIARRFRPHQLSAGGLKQTFRISSSSTQPQPSPSANTQSAAVQCDLPKDSLQSTISVPDLNLFHHWCISTYKTMVLRDPHDIWQYHIVQWGIEFPSILHLVLALSALHLAYERPEEQERYLQQADDNFTFGVRTVTNVLSLQDMNEDNCQQIYMSAVLIIFIYFGRGPRSGQYLIFSDTGPSEWLILMQGVKLTLGKHHQKVFSGVLEPEPPSPLPEITPSIRAELHEHTVHTQAVQRFVEQEASIDDLPIYISALNDLNEMVNRVYERRSAGQLGIAFMDQIIGWLYRLPERFVRLLEEKEPRALVILAYWAVMFRYMDAVWFMEGWAEHVLGGVSTFLQAEYRPWIEWPLQKLREA